MKCIKYEVRENAFHETFLWHEEADGSCSVFDSPEYGQMVKDAELYHTVGEIRRNFVPEKLYRYRGFGGHDEDDFGGLLHFTNYRDKKLDDPLEFPADMDGCWEIWESISADRGEVAPGEEDIESYNSFFEVLKDTIVFASFSESYTLPRMWEHYADFDQGFCVEYDIKKMIGEGKRGEELLLSLYPVIYSQGDRLPFDIKAFMERDNDRIIPALLLKDPVWADQREWRMILSELYSGDPLFIDGNDCVDLSACVTKVILGSECVDQRVDYVLKKARERDQWAVSRLKKARASAGLYEEEILRPGRGTDYQGGQGRLSEA